MTPTPERIVAAALRNGLLVLSAPAPCRHHHVIHTAYSAGMETAHFEQGFLTSAGRFVDRVEAMRIALSADQLVPPRDADGIPYTRKHRELFSEDVW